MSTVFGYAYQPTVLIPYTDVALVDVGDPRYAILVHAVLVNLAQSSGGTTVECFFT